MMHSRGPGDQRRRSKLNQSRGAGLCRGRTVLACARETTMADCLIGVGSNIGDRSRVLDQAVEQVCRSPQVQLLGKSRYYDTPPIGGPPGQAPYLNAALRVATQMSPVQLLAWLQRVRSAIWDVSGSNAGDRVPSTSTYCCTNNGSSKGTIYGFRIREWPCVDSCSCRPAKSPRT